jgi:hypothetical protein
MNDRKSRTRSLLNKLLFATGVGGGLLATVLFVPPVRDRFFATKVWPWPLPWDTNEQELQLLKDLAQPGDVVVESNLHGWQWMALCFAATGTTWVHAALVDEKKRLLTVHKRVIETDWNIYNDWGSTRIALLRPCFRSAAQVQTAIDHARSKLGTEYDPSFRNHAGNCNGLVASALAEAGLPVKTRTCFGRDVYNAKCFFDLPGAEIVWQSDKERARSRTVVTPKKIHI